jgi:hypothetical protein
MVSGLDFARAPRRAPLTARKKGSGYENAFRLHPVPCEYIYDKDSGVPRLFKSFTGDTINRKVLRVQELSFSLHSRRNLHLIQ